MKEAGQRHGIQHFDFSSCWSQHEDTPLHKGPVADGLISISSASVSKKQLLAVLDKDWVVEDVERLQLVMTAYPIHTATLQILW